MTERLTFTAPRGRVDTPGWPQRAPEAHEASAPAPAAVRPERFDWAFFFLVAFTALVFLRPQDTFHALEPLHLAELAAIGGLAALVGGRLSRGQSLTRMTPELAGVIALGAIVLATAPFSIWFGGAVGVFKDMYSKLLLIYLLMTNVLTSRRRIERLTWVVILASAYLGFRACVDAARGIHMVEYGRVEGAVGGMFKNPNDLALNMVSILPLTVFAALRRGPAVRRLLAASCALCMLGAIVVSRSRSGTLGLVAMLAVLGFMAARQKPALVLTGLLLCGMAAPFLPAGYWQRIASITDSQDDTGSKEARRTLFHESLEAFVENPITGVGAGQFQNWNPEGRDQPWRVSHNVILQVAAELGIFGLAAFLFLVARAWLAALAARRLLRRASTGRGRRRTPVRSDAPVLTPAEIAFFDTHTAAMIASLTGWFICALFASVAYNWTFYYLLALAAAPRDALLLRLPSRAQRRASGAVRQWEAAHA